MTWPQVHNEFATIAKLREGYSIARFGDGELKCMDGAGYIREDPNKALAAELRHVLRNPHPKCLRGIPTMDPRSPKFNSWRKHIKRFERFMRRRGEYYSAFISRPDSAPWIRTREYAQGFAALWAGKRVAVVCEESNGLFRALRLTPPAEMVHLPCPRHGAYDHIADFENAVAAYQPDIAILACGVTATCLANRLAKRRIQAIDFGSGGSFLAKLLDD